MRYAAGPAREALRRFSTGDRSRRRSGRRDSKRGFRRATVLDVVPVGEARRATSDARPFSTPLASTRLDVRRAGWRRERARRRSRGRGSTSAFDARPLSTPLASTRFDVGFRRPILMPFASTMARRAARRLNARLSTRNRPSTPLAERAELRGGRHVVEPLSNSRALA